MQCPLDINTIMSVWMNICGSFCLKTNLSWVAPMSVFGYKTIHNFHCLWYNNSIWYTVCQYMSTSWFLIVQGRQQWTGFLCTVWDSLIHHIASMSLHRTGLSREGELNETGGIGLGSTSNGKCKTWLGVDERTKGGEVERQAPGRAKKLGWVSSGEGDQG